MLTIDNHSVRLNMLLPEIRTDWDWLVISRECAYLGFDNYQHEFGSIR